MILSKRFFHKFIAPIRGAVERATQRYDSDKRYRMLFTRPHVNLHLFFQLSDCESQRDLAQELKEDPNLQEVVGCPSVNHSSLSRANARRTFRVFRYIFHALYPKAISCAGSVLKSLEGLKQVKILDESFLECCASMAWAQYRKTKNGLKLHLLLDLRRIPDKLVLTPGRENERSVLKQIFRRGVTYIIDRGYNSYELFTRMTRSGAFFVTRLLANAVFEIIEPLPLSLENINRGVVGDCLIYLGGPNTRCPFKLRLITYWAEDGRIYRYLTNRLDLDPWIVCEMYHWRWQIELFFRFIKQYLKVKRFLGRNENAVLIQLYAALITFMLLQIYAKMAENLDRVTKRVLRRVRRRLFNRVSDDEIAAYLAAIGSG